MDFGIISNKDNFYKMSSSPILSIRQAEISFAKKILFEDLSFNIFQGDRICLIGKNGVGKTSLMKAILEEIDLDNGERWVAPNLKIGYLSQSDFKFKKDQTVDNFISSTIKIDDEKSYLIDIICDNLGLNKSDLIQNLSGGQKRRVNLAKALVFEPDILLLDEPTNHLDLETIKWLEDYLQRYQGALLVISHDRKFLEKVTNKVFWLRSGKMNVNNSGYKNFEEWSSTIINHEQREFNNLQKKYELEKQWLQTGVTARRKRNIGRLHYLKELQHKIQKQHQIISQNQSKISINSAKISHDAPQIIVNLNNVSKIYENKKIINNFSIKILRGEKIGIVGKNGSGKSTFLNLITKNIAPTSGNVKQATDIDISYFDQNRSIIDNEVTLHDVICENGSDYVTLANGKTRHVCGYLKDFLFDPKELKTKAKTLSGGQQNRLLLAKTLANPGNFLILDEPTNDLDMESLDMLQEYIFNYKGTLLIVSHDRYFLDNVATSILAFEDNGNIMQNYGNYSDYEQLKSQKAQDFSEDSKKTNIEKIRTNNKQQKLSNKEKFELEKIPDKIEKLEEKILQLNEDLIQNTSNPADIAQELGILSKKLADLEERWIELYQTQS